MTDTRRTAALAAAARSALLAFLAFLALTPLPVHAEAVRLPMGLVPHRGDSTLLIDYGNNRLLVRAPADGTEQVAVMQGTRYRVDRSPALQPRIPIIGYASQDAWVIASSGEIVIVRGGSFRIDVLGADGRLRMSGRGPGGQMGRSPVADEQEVVRMVGTAESTA